ncbi:exosortase X [Rhodohalobacter sp. 614A]|uniref:exosortase X n=1 Tax=Rhodohalobacter sp. 614A TaxID=2908649 RepID=UPI001F2DEF91|nr:archaeosortase/exosortase family protein [Rhodohalobacter sp. 614A]
MKSFLKSDIAIFLFKVFCIYLVWYIVYELWVLPNGYIDVPLSKNIASVSAGILTFLGEEVFLYGRVVGITGAPGVEIVDGCNGIAAIGLFLGFIFAYPGAWMPRVYFSIFGIAIIYLVNVARIVSLCFIQEYWPQGFEFTHDYSTTAIFYIVIFILWMVWANFGDTVNSGKKRSPVTSAPA